jgi:hypothetical protein
LVAGRRYVAGRDFFSVPLDDPDSGTPQLFDLGSGDSEMHQLDRQIVAEREERQCISHVHRVKLKLYRSRH